MIIVLLDGSAWGIFGQGSPWQRFANEKDARDALAAKGITAPVIVKKPAA